MAWCMTEMASAAEEPREQVERVVRRLTCRAALAVLCDTLVSVLVVDLPRRGAG